jgi:hypothetical protein
MMTNLLLLAAALGSLLGVLVVHLLNHNTRRNEP